MKCSEVVSCMFSKWYPHFKHISIKSRTIELPAAVKEYLLADGLVLTSNDGEPPLSRSGLVGDSDDDEDWNSCSVETASTPSFPDFEAKVACCISALGGEVFPKLDWSSPKDAVWVTFGRTLRCKNVHDIFLLLKSSDFIIHDLTEAFSSCEDSLESADEGINHHLILRKWQSIQPAGEFRCFVQNNTLIGISQRHISAYFPSIVETKQTIKKDLVEFFEKHIMGKFFDANFSFDIWWKSPGVVILIDFNPFGPVTDSLLFTWEELEAGQSDLSCTLDFRIVETNEGVQPDPYRHYAMPQDFVHLTTGEDPAKLYDLLHLKIQTANECESDSDE